MNLSAHNIKEKMNEFARLFSIERNIFQRFVIVYKYIRFCNSDPLVKDILQKIFDDTAKATFDNKRTLVNRIFCDLELNSDKTLNVKYPPAFEFLSEWIPKNATSELLKKSEFYT